MTGFTDGFRTGYGLVSDVKDRELKKTQLENAQSNADRNFGAAEEDRKSTADYRAEDLRIKNINAGTDAAYKAGQLGVQQTQADTANVNAKTAQDKLNNLSDKTSIEYLEKEANIAAKNAATASSVASTGKTNQETSVSEGQQKRFQSALNVDYVYKHADNAKGLYDTETLLEVAKKYQENKGTGIFNFGTLSADVHLRGTQEIGTFLQDSAAGLDPLMSPSIKRAFTTALGIDSSAAFGRTVDQTFKNAPVALQNGKYKIVGQGIHSATMSKGKVGGQLFVEVVNSEDPKDRQFYFPPLTESRSYIDSDNIQLNVEDVMSGVAGAAHFIQNVGPAIKPLVKQARILTKYGNDEGDNGVQNFQAEVTKILESNRKAIQNGSNTGSLFGGVDASLTRDQQLSEPEMADMKNRIEERLLFGAQEKPRQEEVERWLAETEVDVKAAKFDDSGQTLGQIISEDQWSPQLVSSLNAHFDGDQPSNPAELIRELKAKGYLPSGYGAK
jgi:hypothetical protein